MSKVHLAYVDGSIYCGASGRWVNQMKTNTSNKMSEVTCLHCRRKYFGLRINARIKGTEYETR